MANGSEGSYAINLPNQFEPFGNILQRSIAAKSEQNQMMYSNMLREQQKQEQDEWKKLNLIQDLTDISKHQTGSDVANAIGNSQMSRIFQKYTQNAATLSPAQLQYELNKEVSGVVNSMQGVKSELELADEQLKALKQNFPDLNIGQLATDYRKDVLGRRLKNDTEFINPLEVKTSELNLGDPEFLSRYSTGNKNIISSIVDPKGAEAETVLMGKQGDYTKFEGKLPFWKQPSYDRNKFNPEGFYTGREIPSFKIKSSVIPAESLPASGGKPFEVVDKDVYERFAQDGKANIELVASTRKTYPDYDKFNPTEKEYAKRNVLLNQLKSYDQSQLHPTQNVRPTISNTRNYINLGATNAKMDGNEFDRIDKSKIKSDDGSVKLPDFLGGRKVGGGEVKMKLKAEDLPGGTSAILKSAGLDVSDASEFEVGFDDQGRIDWIAPNGGKKIYRTDMENAQLKYNTEPAKGQQLKYGTKPAATRPSATPKKDNDPLGIFQ
jgi:hypothetical protein